MGIGSGIALFVIGAILAFAVNVDLGGYVDLNLIGYILMGAGFLIFMISLILVMRRRSTVSTSRTTVDPANGDQVTTRRTSDNGEPRA
jgi:membrane-bound ClpP family serine protease